MSGFAKSLAALAVVSFLFPAALRAEQCTFQVYGPDGYQTGGGSSKEECQANADAERRELNMTPSPCVCTGSTDVPDVDMPVQANMKQAIAFGAASALSSAISDTVADAVHNFLYGDPAAKAAADAEAAEAERERQAEIARQLAIQEQKRQEMFRRLGQELMGFSDGPQLQLMGMGNSPDLQLMGMDRPNDLQLMGFGNQAPALNAPPAQTPLGPQTCFFGECGPQDPGLQDQIEPWGNSNVVDLRDLQQGVDLASLATKAQPADRQAIMDQALAAANGDKSIRIAMPASTAVPVMSERGLLAFQQANDAYRYAHESALRMQESFNQIEAQRQGLYAVMKVSEEQLEADFQAHFDEMSLAEKEAAMAKIFDAALDMDKAYGNHWMEYLAARQQFYEYKFQTQMYLWDTALGKQGNPPNPPRQLGEATGDLHGQPVIAPTKEDLNLLLPDVKIVAVPTKEDMKLVEDMALESSPQPPDILTKKVIDFLEQERTEADLSNLLTEGAVENVQHELEVEQRMAAPQPEHFPPNIMNQYEANPQFQQTMNAERQQIASTEQQSVQNAVQDADSAWEQKLSQFQNQGLAQPGIPVGQQAQSNPQLQSQINAMQKQITTELDLKVTRAQFEAEEQWQQWIEKEEATLPRPTLTAVAATRE